MTTVDSENLIRDDAGCKDLLLEAMRYHLLPEQRSSLTSERTMERKPDGMRPYIFAIGKEANSCFVDSRRWKAFKAIEGESEKWI